MNRFRHLQTAIICLGVLAIAASLVMFATNTRPSDALIKGIIAKQMEKRLKGGSIVSMTLIRGASFSNEAHNDPKVQYGTTLYPVVVNITYNTKEKDGLVSDNKTLERTLNFYKDPTHKWVLDDELH